MRMDECPVCFKNYPVSNLESHVNYCLSQSDSKNMSKKGNKRARGDISSWCTSNKGDEAKASSSSDAKDDDNPFKKANKEVESKTDKKSVPFAEQMRPKCMDDFVGQHHLLNKDSILSNLIKTENIPSMILWGPPGCGKTSLAAVIGKCCKSAKFVSLSATAAGVAQVKEIITMAKSEWNFFKRKTILFLDEIHRFNKLQQDTFLPIVENGTIILIGATTENPSFSLNSALLSRCRVFVFNKLSADHLRLILLQAIDRLPIVLCKNDSDTPSNDTPSSDNRLIIEDDALTALANLSDGDARIALNCLSLIYQSHNSLNLKSNVIGVSHIKDHLMKTHLLYDRKGDEHYNCISALHKSMRGDDADAALYWLGRMLEGGEDPLYIARRLIRFSSEDVGLADSSALSQAVSTYHACQAIGMPECEVILAQCVVYLAEAPKSVRIYRAYGRVKENIKCHQGPIPGVPLHLRNAPTTLMKQLNYGKDYKYNPDYEGKVQQTYMPEGLEGITFLDPE